MKKDKLSPQAAARTVRSRLRALADPVKAEGARRYFKEKADFYGASSAEVRDLALELSGTVRAAWSVNDAIALCEILLKDRELEAKAVGTLILGRFRKSFPAGLFSRVRSWLAADRMNNWASVDVFCSEVMGPFLLAHPEFVGRIKAWAYHRNRWVKRASLVSFILPARRGLFLEAVYEVVASVFGVDDDLIHKANGWLLREAGKTDPARLERFLLAHGPSIPRTTLRYAIERFTEAKRRTLLSKTRPK